MIDGRISGYCGRGRSHQIPRKPSTPCTTSPPSTASTSTSPEVDRQRQNSDDLPPPRRPHEQERQLSTTTQVHRSPRTAWHRRLSSLPTAVAMSALVPDQRFLRRLSVATGFIHRNSTNRLARTNCVALVDEKQDRLTCICPVRPTMYTNACGAPLDHRRARE